MAISAQQWIGAVDTTRAPMFRREFDCKQRPREAFLLISGVGYYEAWINGCRVGDHVLDPAQTDYDLRVFYVRYDVTEALRAKCNTLGVMLGNGWYNQDRVWGEHGLSYGQPRMLAELHLAYDDGTTDIIRADEEWRWAPGPITENNVYAGECYDARLESEGWTRPGFDDSEWCRATPQEPPGGELQEQVMPPMRRIGKLRPVAIREAGAGHYVVDFGQNFAGWVRIRVDAESGAGIDMRFAETVDADGKIDTSTTGVFATGVEQVDRYVCKGGGPETWEPRFTYHGFRYVEITGWPGHLTAEDLRGVVVHNDLNVAGAFECSDERFNRLHRMALWTHRSNMHGLPEDCPARERCGWLGDANLVAEYSLWNYDANSFWEKYLDDIETTRTFNNGIPGDVAPGKRGSRNPAQPDWAAAFIMLPWYLYQFSGDDAVVLRHWQGMTKLMSHFQDCAQDWILPEGYGDFFDPGTDAIVMHTPHALSTTLWFYRCSCVMTAMADALADADSAAMYRDWKQHIRSALTDRYFDPQAGSFGSQTSNAMALAFDLFPEEEQRILQALVKDIRERDDHMNVGVMGVRFLFEVLTERGEGALARSLMHQDTYPSFGHLIARGATTLWECWGEAAHDGTHGPRSLNHPFMGGYDNWFFNTLAGIRIDPEHPGFSHFFLSPHLVSGLDWLRCYYDCRYGRIESSWRVEEGEFCWKLSVPEGTSATAILPVSGNRTKLSAGTHEMVEKLHVRRS